MDGLAEEFTAGDEAPPPPFGRASKGLEGSMGSRSWKRRVGERPACPPYLKATFDSLALEGPETMNEAPSISPL